jgi:hypothetical protein
VLLKRNNLPIAVGLRVVLVVFQPVPLLHVQLRLKPLVKERHDTHHLSVYGLRDVLSHEFVAELQHIVPADLVHVGLADDLPERGEETPLGLNGFVRSLGEFKIGEVGVNLIFDDFPPELDEAWSGRRGLAAQPLILYLIELQLALVLSLQRIPGNRNPRVIEVQEVRSFGVLLLHVLPFTPVTSTASGLHCSFLHLKESFRSEDLSEWRLGFEPEKRGGHRAEAHAGVHRQTLDGLARLGKRPEKPGDEGRKEKQNEEEAEKEKNGADPAHEQDEKKEREEEEEDDAEGR